MAVAKRRAIDLLRRRMLELRDQQRAGAFELDHVVPVACARGFEELPYRPHPHEAGSFTLHFFHVVEELHGPEVHLDHVREPERHVSVMVVLVLVIEVHVHHERQGIVVQVEPARDAVVQVVVLGRPLRAREPGEPVAEIREQHRVECEMLGRGEVNCVPA